MTETDEKLKLYKPPHSFETDPNTLCIVGTGFLGKYLLLRCIEGYQEFTKDLPLDRPKKQPFVSVIDIAHPDTLFKFPLLDKYENEGYVDYNWLSMGEPTTLKRKQIAQNYENIVITSAIADVPFAMENPILTYQTNVMATLNFMEYLRTEDFKGKIIHMSSESVYGHHPPEELPLKETTLPNPANIYGSSKLAQEQIILTYAKSYGLNATVLRSATMYGPYSRTKQAMPIFIRQILDRKPVTLDGDGTQTRDFVYVEDTARAIELALYTEKNIRGEIINVGSGKEIAFINLINLIGYTIGLKPEEIKINHRPFRAGEEGLRVHLSIDKAKELLGYQPEYPMTGITESGLKSTIMWVANWILNYDKKEMEDLDKKLNPLKYAEVKPETVT